uniref:Ig-like domain-containing protein n=1 Tax=Ditylenchus dipsaci TaxID=166011 RepID=A0A915E5V3_9BILA
MDLNRKQSVPWSFCDSKQRPIELSRSCNKQACPPTWDISEFSQCSHSCNGGIRTRRVRCIRRVSRVGGAESTLILPEEQCPVPKPNDQEPCGLENCPATWKIGQWSSCSASCGDGEQRRVVECEQVDVLGTVRVFNPPTQCLGMERPPTVQLCNMGSCEGMRQPHYKAPSAMPLVQKSLNDDPRLDYDHVDPSREDGQVDGSQKGDHYEQSHENHKKLTLNVGGYANLYEGTSIKVKCPVRNFDRQRIYWTKDGKKLVNNAHTKVSSNGALRIFHARMEDAGLYACFANGVHGNVTLKFKHRDAPNSANKQPARSNETKQKPIKDNILKVNSENSSSSPKVDKELFQKIRTIADPSLIKIDFAVGEWSQCSQLECGKPDGAQVRMLKCQIFIDQLNSYVEDEICEGFGLARPPATRPCNDPNCPKWEASDWSECGESRCIRHATALQRREVKCIYTNGTEAEFSLCDRKNRPKIKKECVNLNCTAEWRPSVWGKCSKSCGDGGVQQRTLLTPKLYIHQTNTYRKLWMRLLRCVWHGTKKAAGRNCDPIQRPSAIRVCEPTTKIRACEAADDAAAASTADNWPKQMTQKNSTMNASEEEDCEDKSRSATY